VTRYSIIHKDGTETAYVWCDKTKQMIVDTGMKTATIYSNGSQECERMASLLKNLGGEFLEYKLDKHFSQRAFEQEFGPEATYPQVSIGYKHIGSMKDALQYLKEMGMFK
jgi:glutaredoxin